MTWCFFADWRFIWFTSLISKLEGSDHQKKALEQNFKRLLNHKSSPDPIFHGQETINAIVSYEVGWVGRMLTFAQGMSSFGVNAAIRDLSARSRRIHFEALEKLSLGNIIGNLKIVSKVPVLVPELDNSELTETKIVTIQLTRGHHYRFDVFGAAKAELAGSPSSGSASTNFADPFLDGDTANGGITIHNFSIDVATDSDQDITNLKMLVDSLQQSVGDLADHVDGTEENLSAQIDETRQEIALVFARLDERFADLEVEVHGLTEDVAGLHGELATLQQQVQGLTSQIAVLQQNLLDHTHPYLTGAGAGHNNTSATTGAATIP